MASARLYVQSHDATSWGGTSRERPCYYDILAIHRSDEGMLKRREKHRRNDRRSIRLGMRNENRRRRPMQVWRLQISNHQ